MQQKYVLTELDTGERVISERLAHVRSVSIGFWIGAGSRDETDAKAGISHFIEHLLFKGTASYSAQQIAEIFDTLGGELNAATSREHTVVYARVPDERLETALDVMGEMVFAPSFAELDAEREIPGAARQTWYCSVSLRWKRRPGAGALTSGLRTRGPFGCEA